MLKEHFGFEESKDVEEWKAVVEKDAMLAFVENGLTLCITVYDIMLGG